MPPTALITGASSGIGLELARCFARRGYRCVLVARRLEKLLTAAEDLRSAESVEVITIAEDLADTGAPGRIYERVRAGSREVDALVNAAGFGLMGPFDRQPVDRQLDLVQIHATATAHLCRLYMADFTTRRSGHILNVASVAGFLPGPRMALYHASKAFVVSLSLALHKEGRKNGVTVSVLCPGPTQTGFLDRAGLTGTGLHRGALLGMSSAAGVAECGCRGLLRGRAVIVPGLRNKALVFSTRLLPRRLAASLARRYTRVSRAEREA